MMPKRPLVLVTGGAGFIGSHTADALRGLGYRVRILDNLLPPVHANRWPSYVRNKGFELMRGDVRKKGDWARALKGVSVVYHFAAYQDQRSDFGTFFDVNTRGTALLYEIIVSKKLPIRKVIIASSQFVYGDGKYQCSHSKKFFYPELRPLSQFKKRKFDIVCTHGSSAKFSQFTEDQPLTPTNSYGLSKEALEYLALRFGKTYGIPTTIFRYSIVQGARQSPRNLYSGALRIFVTQALAGKPITVYEDGKQLRDFINISDVVRANILALKNKKTDFEVFNVGGGRAYRVLDFAKMIKELARSSSEFAIGGFRRTDTRHAVSDIAKLKKIGWGPRHTPRESVEEYIAWLRGKKD